MSSLRRRHQDKIRHAQDLLGKTVKDKGEDLRRQGEASDHNGFLIPVKDRRKKGGEKKSQASTHF